MGLPCNFRCVLSKDKYVKSIYVFNRYYSPKHFAMIIGNREVVGNGKNSEYSYIDHPSFPFPAIRFLEATPDILALREKEKGDWRNITIEEKKMLYRASFCQTYAEMLAPSGEWKSIIGWSLVLISLGVWLHMGLRRIFNLELPESFLPESKRAQFQRMIDLEVNPVLGMSSKWDYKNRCWK